MTTAESLFVQRDLAQWGPGAPERPVPSSQDAEEYCRGVACGHYENFPVVTRFLPRELRQPFYNVYAYCRWADDLGDEIGDPARSVELLEWWRLLVLRCWENDATHPVFIALNKTRKEYALPIQPFLDLIDAFLQDQKQTRYETYAELQDYCTRSANPVGRILLHLFRSVTPQTLQWSDNICTGLQLTNFWQDVNRDYDIGRIYLPQEDCRRFGYTLQDFEGRITNGAFVELMAFQVQRARELLLQGLPLADYLPRKLALDIELFARGGLRILQKIEQGGYRVWEVRPVLTKGDLLGCLTRGLTHTLFTRTKTISNR